MKISDEIRNWCEDTTPWPSRNDAREIADRIDRELVELPKDADGVPIHVGDTVCECVSGMKLIVNGMRLTDTWAVSTNHGLISRASDVTHTRPDSWKRIADDLEAKTSSCGHQGFTVVSRDEVVQIADRIRKLAKEGK